MNNDSYIQYFYRLMELSISMFEWNGLPKTVDPRYLELHLFKNGSMVYFRDEVMGDLCLDCIANGQFDVYGNPISRRAYSSYNQYQKTLNESDSVIIWNNYLRQPSVLDVKMFAKRLYNLDRIIDVNVNAQKTPVLVQGTEKQRLTLVNLYKEFDGNAPFIFGDKNLDLNSLRAISTNAPYVADKLYQLKTQIWNEALTYLGISNLNIQKKERMITDEVQRNQGGTIASRYSRLEARREAVEKINNMFGTDISVDYREDFQITNDSENDANDNDFGKKNNSEW
uniref:Upper collar protein n=1 Tax=Podoviridae sp. ct3lO13 TaxID=2826538 RepID=A0A8S5QSB6_9CAUD|nr:MAG TPA: upper collar protein [Podoviridae sp. ct3lO13]